MLDGLTIEGTLVSFAPGVNARTGQVLNGLMRAVVREENGKEWPIDSRASLDEASGPTVLPAFDKLPALVNRWVRVKVFPQRNAAGFTNYQAVDVEAANAPYGATLASES